MSVLHCRILPQQEHGGLLQRRAGELAWVLPPKRAGRASARDRRERANQQQRRENVHKLHRPGGDCIAPPAKMLDAAAPAHATAVTAATPAAELDTDADEALRLSRQIAQQLLHVSDLLHAHSAAELRARVPGREMVTAIKQARQVVQRELRSTAALLSELEAVLANCPAHSRDHDRIRATVDRHKAEMNRLQGTARQARTRPRVHVQG